MLAVDWLGCGLTVGVLALLLQGRLRLPRALLAMVLGEAGRLLLTLLTGGTLVSMTMGGAFSRWELQGWPPVLVQAGGLLVGALLGRLLSRRVAKDTLLYGLLAGAAMLVFRG